MAYMPTWKERLEDAKRFTGPIVAGLVVLALAGWLVWHEWLPHEREKHEAVPPKDEAALRAAQQKLSSEVDVLEKTYRRAIEAGEGDAAVRTLLDRTIARQRERLALEPAGNTVETARLARLEAERSAVRSRVARARSLALEGEAQTAQTVGQTGESLDKLREALRLQREANAAATTDELKDVPRESRLAQTIAQAEAGPAHLAVETALTLARAAGARGERDAALRAFAEARAKQNELNQRFPDTSFADVTLPDRIDAEIASLNAAALLEASVAREHEAEAAITAGRVADAASALAAAGAAQREINEKYSRSRAASAPRAEELETRRQTWLSTSAFAQVAALGDEIVALLRRRQNAVAVQKITAGAALAQKAAAEFPRSSAADAVLQRRLAFLASHSGDLEALQAQVYASVAALPGEKNISMLKTEVPQELYARVMGANPSRNAGRALPVDSVSWLDAREFCERLGWLLGARVRLPTEAEFRAAYGSGAGAWSAGTSDGRSHETGKSTPTAAGLADLAGNLAEWLQPASEAGETAPVAGGSYLDTAEALQQLQITLVEKRERARHIGFRFVVELAPDGMR